MPQHAADYIKSLINQRKTVDSTFSVQKMCDDLNLPKSTIDKFLARQTVDTSWNNVSLMVAYLGGSLDHLAGIQRAAALDDAAKQIQNDTAQKDGKDVTAEHAALALLVESYEKEILRSADQHREEIDRIASQQTDYLDRFRRLIDQSRGALVEQHAAAYTSLSTAYTEAVTQLERHLKSAFRGRNAWRALAIVLLLLLVSAGIYAVWEFSDIYSGITGVLLRRNGLIP